MSNARYVLWTVVQKLRTDSAEKRDWTDKSLSENDAGVKTFLQGKDSNVLLCKLADRSDYDIIVLKHGQSHGCRETAIGAINRYGELFRGIVENFYGGGRSVRFYLRVLTQNGSILNDTEIANAQEFCKRLQISNAYGLHLESLMQEKSQEKYLMFSSGTSGTLILVLLSTILYLIRFPSLISDSLETHFVGKDLYRYVAERLVKDASFGDTFNYELRIAHILLQAGNLVQSVFPSLSLNFVNGPSNAGYVFTSESLHRFVDFLVKNTSEDSNFTTRLKAQFVTEEIVKMYKEKLATSIKEEKRSQKEQKNAEEKQKSRYAELKEIRKEMLRAEVSQYNTEGF